MAMHRNELYRSTLLYLLAALLVTYSAIWLFFGGKVAIESFNIVVLSFSVGIVVAYFPNVIEAFKTKTIHGGDILAVGIFLAWLGNGVMSRSGSILWRYFDRPPSWLESGLWGLYIDVAAMGAMCHLVAPRAVEGRVPPVQWLKVGAVMALVVFFLGMVFVADFG
jgi:hypothetical protein